MVQSTGQQISSCFYRPEVVQTCQMSNRQLIGMQEESRGSATGGMGVCSGSPGTSRGRKLLECVHCLGGLQERQFGVYPSGPQTTMFSLNAGL